MKNCVTFARSSSAEFLLLSQHFGVYKTFLLRSPISCLKVCFGWVFVGAPWTIQLGKSYQIHSILGYIYILYSNHFCWDKQANKQTNKQTTTTQQQHNTTQHNPTCSISEVVCAANAWQVMGFFLNQAIPTPQAGRRFCIGEVEYDLLKVLGSRG